MRYELAPDDVRAFAPEAKIGLLATVGPDGLPHISLITSIQGGRSPKELTWGQFCEGLSKRHVRHNDKVGFLVMSAERQVWVGRARWTHAEQEGEEYIRFNQMPMFRYNSYTGIHTVHFMELVDLVGPEKLSLPVLTLESLTSAAAGSISTSLDRSTDPRALNAWTMKHLANPGTLKFVAWLDEEGYPRISPLVPAAPLNKNQVALGPLIRSKDVARIPTETTVALFALNLQMESVLLRGFLRSKPAKHRWMATLDVDWVYNSMPPVPGQIFPQESLAPLRDFETAI